MYFNVSACEAAETWRPGIPMRYIPRNGLIGLI